MLRATESVKEPRDAASLNFVGKLVGNATVSGEQSPPYCLCHLERDIVNLEDREM